MLTREVRSAVLGDFPPGTPLLVVASAPNEFARLAAERNDPAVRVIALAPDAAAWDPALGASEHIVLEGLDDVEDPVALLTELRVRAPHARLFALVANAAHLRGLEAFFGGTPAAHEHPLTRAELAPLFTAAGWNPLLIRPVADASLVPAHAPPVTIDLAGMSFRLADAAAVERHCTAAFVVVADRA